MATAPKHQRITVRTARQPREGEPRYVLIDGAPPHYISGYGMVGPGEIVTLAEGVKPGKWLQAVNPKDAAKAEK